MTFIDNKKKINDREGGFFTCSTTAYNHSDGKEFFAIGNSLGQLFYVETTGVTFTKDHALSLPGKVAITAMAADPRTRILMIGNGLG
jgi:hypothetical protein